MQDFGADVSQFQGDSISWSYEMKILFLATNFPIPINNGHAIRSLSIIRALESCGHKLSFISFVNKDRPKDLSPLSSCCSSIDLLEREMPNLTEGANYLCRLGPLLALKSFSIERFRSEAMEKKLQDKLHTQHYDLIVSDGIYALTNLPETEIPIVLNCHNVEYVIPKRYAQLEGNPFKKYYALIESHLLRIAERRLCDRATLAMVCSQVDLQLLRQLQPNLSIFVVPNVVDTDLFSPLQKLPLRGVEGTLLFQGGMDWYPNRDAVEYFVQTILPKVRAECPRTKFVVAGRNPSVQFMEKFKSDPLIIFTGTVMDMRPYMAAASVVIVPLRIGGGTRIKILEACAAGKPVVSTSIGAEGLDLKPGSEIILADEPVEFARSVVMMLQDPRWSEAVAMASRTAVVERYSQPVLVSALETVMSVFTRQHSA